MSTIDPQRWRAASPHVDELLELPEAARRAHLSALRARQPLVADDVQRLLDEHDALRRDAFLEENFAADGDRPFDVACAGAISGQLNSEGLAGRELGAYTLLSPIGEGGMGSVWLAERSDGRFEGRAAVKLLHMARLGPAGQERFRREGTILARVTHPHIAHLIDAGVSPDGQPFLVLEHVDGGQPIDHYCDAHALDVPARLRLLLDVLTAVAHAHANLVVHRDIKPSNVLVRANGPDFAKGQVKLLDFGIAKLLAEEGEQDATEDGLTPMTLTRQHGVALTPAYAAPEQVTRGPITTATDVYALGVLLYVLLTGQHPVGAGLTSPADLLRAILDTDAPRPSDIVGDTRTCPADRLAAIAASRASTPDRLQRLLHGDLDTIIAKALKKDPAERYASVTALADDVRRYLASEPISARPDSIPYRTGKFLRRHATAVLAAVGVVAVLAAVVGFYTWRLATARDRARAQAENARYQAEKSAKATELMTSLLTGVDPFADKQEPTVRGVLDAAAIRLPKELADQPELKAEMLTVLGRVYQRLGLFDNARPLLAEAVSTARRFVAEGGRDPHERQRRLAYSLREQGVLLRMTGNGAASAQVIEEALALLRSLPDPPNKELATTINELGRTSYEAGRFPRAEALYREALAMRREVLGEEHPDTSTSIGDLASVLREKGDLAGAEALYRQTVAINTKVYGERHLNRANAMNNLAIVLTSRGNHAEAERLLRESLAITRERLGDQHRSVAVRLSNLANVVMEQGRYDEAEPLIEEALRVSVATLGDDHPIVAGHREAFARVLAARGDWVQAEAMLRRAMDVRVRAFPAGDRRIATVKSKLGEALTHLERYAEAEPLLLEAYDVFKSGPKASIKEPNATLGRLTALYEACGRPQEAARYRALATQ